MTTLDIPRYLAVVDDDRHSAEPIKKRLERRGYAVALVTPPSPHLADTLEEVRRVAGAALCDHRLRDQLAVQFSGAALVAEMTSQGFPAVLFTGVQPEEKFAIRRHMDRIPGFLDRSSDGGLKVPNLLAALQDSVDEVLGDNPPPRRRTRRTPVTIVSSRRTGGMALVSILISGWEGSEPFEVEADRLPEPWRRRPGEAAGKTFFAWSNIGEPDERRLFVRDFEPEPVQTDTFVDGPIRA